MNKKTKNGVDTPKKTKSSKKLTKKDLELVISSLEDKQLRLKAEFDNFRKRKESEISSLLKYEGKNFVISLTDACILCEQENASFTNKSPRLASCLEKLLSLSSSSL